MSIFLGKCQWLDDGVRQKLYTHNFYVNCNVSLDVKTKVHDCLSIMQHKSPQYRKLWKIFAFAPSATSMKSKTNYTVCSTVIFYDSLGSNFCRDSSIGHPPFKNFDNNQKTLLIFDNVDPHICRLQICNEECR